MEIHGHDRRAKMPRQNQRLPARPATQIEDARLGRQRRQAPNGLSCGLVATRTLAGNADVQCKQSFQVHVHSPSPILGLASWREHLGFSRKVLTQTALRGSDLVAQALARSKW